MNGARVCHIDIDIARGDEGPSRAIMQMGLGFIMEVPTSAGIATKSAVVEGKIVQNLPENWLDDQPDEVLGIDDQSNERDPH